MRLFYLFLLATNLSLLISSPCRQVGVPEVGATYWSIRWCSSRLSADCSSFQTHREGWHSCSDCWPDGFRCRQAYQWACVTKSFRQRPESLHLCTRLPSCLLCLGLLAMGCLPSPSCSPSWRRFVSCAWCFRYDPSRSGWLLASFHQQDTFGNDSSGRHYGGLCQCCSACWSGRCTVGSARH